MDRLAQLEQQAAAITAEIAAIKASKTSPPQPPLDDRAGVRITELVEPSNFVRPTEKELRQLYEIVLAKYPQLAPHLSSRWADDEKREHFDGFVWSFERLGYIGRTAMPDQKHYVSFWSSECRDWLARHRPAHRGNIGAGFLAAVVASGDIPYVVGNPSQGFVWLIGVVAHGGAKANDKWRNVLRGELLPPTLPARRYG
jgi:hypothetical protein